MGGCESCVLCRPIHEGFGRGEGWHPPGQMPDDKSCNLSHHALQEGASFKVIDPTPAYGPCAPSLLCLAEIRAKGLHYIRSDFDHI